MILTFLDMQDRKNPRNRTPVNDQRELVEVLDSLQSRRPFFCQLRGESGATLDIGVGEPGCVQHTPSDINPPYLMAVSPGQEYGDGHFEFLAGGTPTPVAARYCLPFSLVKKIVMEFQETGLRSSAVSWEEI
jgi:hypothetical protein